MYNFAYEILLIFVGFLFAWLYTIALRYRDKKAFQTGNLRHEVIVVANTIEREGNGVLVLKPRTAQSAEPLLRAFPNPILAEQIVAATVRCNNVTPEGMFIRLTNPVSHEVFLKRVVDIVSELAAEGHILRMNGRTVNENECYVTTTFSAHGPHRKIRLDIISAANLKKFLDPAFGSTLTHRADEGSHADLASVFTICATQVFNDYDASRQYVRRVSIPTRV